MTVFNLGTNQLTEGVDFTAFDPYFPAPGFTYYPRASLSESSYLSFQGYVIVVTELQVPGPANFRAWEDTKIFPSPFPVYFPVTVFSNLPAGVQFRHLARVVKTFKGQVPDNITLTLEFDDQAFQAL